MTLKELGEEYNKAYLRLMEKITILRKDLKNYSGNALIVQQRRILSLYLDALNCRKVYEKLINYYRK